MKEIRFLIKDSQSKDYKILNKMVGFDFYTMLMLDPDSTKNPLMFVNVGTYNKKEKILYLSNPAQNTDEFIFLRKKLRLGYCFDKKGGKSEKILIRYPIITESLVLYKCQKENVKKINVEVKKFIYDDEKDKDSYE